MRDSAISPVEPLASGGQDLLRQFRAGSDAAFEALFRLHQRAVRGWIVRMVRDPGAADKLTVETFWRIYRARERFDTGREFEPWARRIASRTALPWAHTHYFQAKSPQIHSFVPFRNHA